LHIDATEPLEVLMTSHDFDEIASDIDDASTVAEELQEDQDADAGEKLDELHRRLEHASDMIDEIADKDEKK
jgi:DNA invertase Pin-like site-specific DNA recombinase